MCCRHPVISGGVIHSYHLYMPISLENRSGLSVVSGSKHFETYLPLVSDENC